MSFTIAWLLAFWSDGCKACKFQNKKLRSFRRTNLLYISSPSAAHWWAYETPYWDGTDCNQRTQVVVMREHTDPEWSHSNNNKNDKVLYFSPTDIMSIGNLYIRNHRRSKTTSMFVIVLWGQCKKTYLT